MTKLFKNKRVVMATSLLVGVLMLSVPTFAEMSIKSGYDKFKDAVKGTAETIFTKADNYTADVTFSLKDNDKVILKSTNQNKYDKNNSARESIGVTISNGEEKNEFYYRDSSKSINLSKDGIYHVIEYQNPISNVTDEKNPFDEEYASDIEKIIDAAVAGLKDNVIVEDKADGSKEFSGSIAENQVPAIINTVSSYMFKNAFRGEMRQNKEIPVLTNDIYIKNVSGKAAVDKSGILDNVFASISLSGKEKNGTDHNITLEVLVTITNINSTTVTAPDLTGKNVLKSVGKGGISNIDVALFSGNYKNDIVVIENGKYVKIGERFVTIAHADSDMLEGRYYEVYAGDYASKYKAKDLKFAAKKENDKNSRSFAIMNSDGETHDGSIYLNMNSGNINFYSDEAVNGAEDSFNGEFARIFN